MTLAPEKATHEMLTNDTKMVFFYTSNFETATAMRTSTNAVVKYWLEHGFLLNVQNNRIWRSDWGHAEPLPPKGSSHVNLWELQPHSQGLSQGTSRRELWKWGCGNCSHVNSHTWWYRKRNCILKEHKEAETNSSRNWMEDRLKKFQNTYKSRCLAESEKFL